MQSPQPMQNILYHEKLSIKRSRSQEMSFSHNVFLTTSFSPRLSHTVFLTTSFSHLHIRPHNVVLTALQYSHNPSVLYKYPKISKICLSSYPRNFDVAHLQYIFCHRYEVSEPWDRGFISKCRGQSVV